MSGKITIEVIVASDDLATVGSMSGHLVTCVSDPSWVEDAKIIEIAVGDDE